MMTVDDALLGTLPWFLRNPSATKNLFKQPSASYLVLDVEAVGPDKASPVNNKSDLRLACWTIVLPGFAPVTKYLWGDEFSMGPLLEDIESVEFVVAHHAKYELQWLKRCGAELRDILVWCTFLGQWVLDGNRMLPRDLGSLCTKYKVSAKWDLIKLFFEGGLTVDDVPKSWILEYCLQDIKSTHEVFLAQRELVYERDQQHLVFQRCLTVACLADIEFSGMHLDPERIEDEHQRVITALTRCEAELREITKGINLNSPKQLGQFLYEDLGFSVPTDRSGKPVLTSSGARPTDSATLASLHGGSEQQQNFLVVYGEYNRLSSLYSKSLGFFKGVCDHYGGTFRGVFNQGIAQNHRLSSSGVPLLFPGDPKPKRAQFQNLPREYKKLFDSGHPDYLLCEADGAQLEFRVAADLGKDRVAYQEIVDGVDIHAITAEELYNAGEPEMLETDDPKERRQRAKSRSFRPLTYSGLE